MVKYKGKAIKGKYSFGSNTKLDEQKGEVANINRSVPGTCDNATEWCSENCYAKEGMLVYWNFAYKTELELPEEFPDLVRLHSSGDFKSVRYIEFIKKTVREHPDTIFWTYTKDWRDPKLKIKLDELRQYDNIQVFASLDHSVDTGEIEESGIGNWRKAWIEIDDRKQGIMCPHDAGKADSCYECGLCFRDIDTDIIFKEK